MIYLSLFALLRLFGTKATTNGDSSSEEENDGVACTLEYNPICCPDPRFYELPIEDYREYSNVCLWGYGKDENDEPEDAIACGYGTCPICQCPMLYDPVCCGGQEYPSQCEADCSLESDCVVGKCEDTCICTYEYRPVCCSQFDPPREYGNPCGAECDGLSSAELIACRYGTCEREEDMCACPLIYDPVCCGGEDFASQCVADCEYEGASSSDDDRDCSPGVCQPEEPCICTLDWNPVCCPINGGPDGTTYGNPCQARCADEDLFPCYYGECPSAPCPMIYAPTCCSGTEYGNDCEAEAAGEDTNECTGFPCPMPADVAVTGGDEDEGKEDTDESGQGSSGSSQRLSESKEDAIEDELEALGETLEKVLQQLEEKKKEVSSETMRLRLEALQKRLKEKWEAFLAEFENMSDEDKAKLEEVKEEWRAKVEEIEDRLEERLREYEESKSAGKTAYGSDNDDDDDDDDDSSDDSDEEPKYGGKTAYGSDKSDKGDDSSDDSDDSSDKSDSDSSDKSDSGSSDDSDSGDRSYAFEDYGLRDCRCTLEYVPVCCDGNTYGNQCEAECDGKDASRCSDDACDDSLCVCTREFHPVCCPGTPHDEQFANPCTAACSKSSAELITCYYGQCESVCACPFIEDPVCCQGNEYANQCAAECAGFHPWSCDAGKCDRVCTLEYEPHCCDGQEYPNLCSAEVAGATNCKAGTCEPECHCPMDYVPLCCGDKTYGNVCAAQCAEEDLVECSYGECEETCDCKKDKEKTVCCNGEDEYRNMCIAKCAGENKKNCEEKTCSNSQFSPYGGEQGPSATSLGLYQYGFNVNTVLLGLILVSMVAFVCMYYKRTDAVQLRKQVHYDTDQ